MVTERFLKEQIIFIHSEGKFTAVVGVDDLVVVNTEDVTLVVHRDKVEMVKDMVEILKKGGEKTCYNE